MSFLRNSTLSRSGTRISNVSATTRRPDFADERQALHESRMLNTKSMRRMQHTERSSEGSWHGMAFLIEAVVLLAFLAVCITVFFRLFAYSKTESTSTLELTHAITYASNAAEQFAVDPEGMSNYTYEQDGLTTTCTVEPRQTEGGTLFDATITVTSATKETIYTLSTSTYVSGVA